MGVCRFEDLRVWQAAKAQSDRVGALLKRPEFARDFELSSQMNRAALSVMLNISEGFLRRQDRETRQFLRYAFASNGEVKAAYYAAEGRAYLSSADLQDHIALNDSIARMLRRWLAQLHDGPGTRDQGRTRDRGRTMDHGRTKAQGPGTKDQS